MKQTQYHETDHTLVDLLSAQQLLKEKTRINVYMPKVVVRVLDDISGKRSRGETISALVLKEAQSGKKLPWAVFSGVEISDADIKTVTHQWGKSFP